MSHIHLADAEPCPFCGSKRIVKGERYFAMCVDCGATGPERNADASVRKFSGDWNNRPLESALKLELDSMHQEELERHERE